MAFTTLFQRVQRDVPNSLPQVKKLLNFLANHAGDVRRLDTAKSVTSSTTLVDAATDFSIELSKGKCYEVEAYGAFTNSGGTQGGKVALTYSGTAVFNGVGILTNGGTTVSAGDRIDASAVALGAAIAEGTFLLKAVVCPSTDGRISLQFAQSVSGTTASILATNALLRVRVID
jgi:hypothetical protein